jgi:Flp pilus assembly protein TadD
LPENLQIRYRHVLSLLALGDKAGLRRACSELLDRFGNSTDSDTANNVAWYCVLAPDAVADGEAPVRLAELAVSGAPQAQESLFLNTLGAALYRAGRFQQAISRLEEGIRQRGGESSVQDWTFLALAHHRLGHDAEAHSWLERIRTYRPSQRTDDFWDELEIRLLRSEAESVILYDSAFPSDPFARN